MNDLYLEPVTDDVVGCLLEVETILEAPEAQNVVTKKKKVESKDKVKVKSKDIRSMFTNVSKEIEVSNAETQHVIEISDSDSELGDKNLYLYSYLHVNVLKRRNPDLFCCCFSFQPQFLVFLARKVSKIVTKKTYFANRRL